MTDTKTIDKIRKLLKVANHPGTGEAEAQTFLLKAQQIMVEQGYSMEDVDGEVVGKQAAVIEGVVELLDRKEHWKGWIASVIARNFRCYTFWRGRRGKGLRQQITFLGRESDVSIATEVYKSACQSVERLSEKYTLRREVERGQTFGSLRQKIKTTWIGGFIEGLDQQFAAQVTANCYALVLVKDEGVEEQYDKLNVRKGAKSQTTYDGDLEAAFDGYETGKKFDVTTTKKIGRQE